MLQQQLKHLVRFMLAELLCLILKLAWSTMYETWICRFRFLKASVSIWAAARKKCIVSHYYCYFILIIGHINLSHGKTRYREDKRPKHGNGDVPLTDTSSPYSTDRWQPIRDTWNSLVLYYQKISDICHWEIQKALRCFFPLVGWDIASVCYKPRIQGKKTMNLPWLSWPLAEELGRLPLTSRS